MKSSISKSIVVLASAAVIAAGSIFIGCSTNPATGKQEFVPFMPSRDEQVKLGLSSAQAFEKQGGGKLNNPVIQKYVSDVGNKIVSHIPASERSSYKFTFTVLNDKAVNAFALPGGPIYITRGILYKMESENQLAFVLGHEAGHVVAEHSARQMSKATEMQLLITGATIAVGDKGGTASQIGLEAGKLAGQMYLLKYGRDEESQADTLGLKYLAAAGYDTEGSIGVMRVLDKASGGSKGTDWFSTHPAPANRLETLAGQIKSKYPGTRNNPSRTVGTEAYQKNVLRQLAIAGQWEEVLAMVVKPDGVIVE